jgi:hypothetical protein
MRVSVNVMERSYIRQSVNVKLRHIFHYINSKEKVTCACFCHGHGKAHLSKYQCQAMNWLVVLGQAVYMSGYNDCKYQVFLSPRLPNCEESFVSAGRCVDNNRHLPPPP